MILLVMLCVSTAYGCDQELYDRLYLENIHQVLDRPLTQKAVDNKNNNIEFLRRLCNNQLSSYEKGIFPTRRSDYVR